MSEYEAEVTLFQGGHWLVVVLVAIALLVFAGLVFRWAMREAKQPQPTRHAYRVYDWREDEAMKEGA